MHLELAGLFGDRQLGQRLLHALFQFGQALERGAVGALRLFQRYVGGDNHPDLLADVVEGQHLVEEEQAGIGDTELVLGFAGQPLNEAHCVIGEKADRARAEGWKACDARRFVAAECIAERCEGVAFKMRGALALGDGEVAAASDDALVGMNADEGVAAHLLAVFDRLQQKALALSPGRAEESRNRGFQVGRERAVDRNEGVVLRQSEELFAAGLAGLRVGFHMRQCNGRRWASARQALAVW